MLLPVKTVGVMGDGRTYDFVVGLRAVTSTDGMTADFYPFDMELHRPRRDAHHQRGEGRQPRGVRRDQQAAGHDRVGVKCGHIGLVLVKRVRHWRSGSDAIPEDQIMRLIEGEDSRVRRGEKLSAKLLQ